MRIERWSQGYNFMQWGIASDPYVAQNYSFTIPDDSPCYDVVPKPLACVGNTRGTFALAADASKAASRSTMVFVNMEDNSFLDKESGFVPFGVVADEESWAALLNVTDRWLETIYLPMVYGGERMAVSLPRARLHNDGGGCFGRREHCNAYFCCEPCPLRFYYRANSTRLTPCRANFFVQRLMDRKH